MIMNRLAQDFDKDDIYTDFCYLGKRFGDCGYSREYLNALMLEVRGHYVSIEKDRSKRAYLLVRYLLSLKRFADHENIHKNT